MTVVAVGTVPATSLPEQPAKTPWPTRSWPTDSLPEPRKAEITALADEAFSASDDGPFGMSLALAVVHRGRLVLERYGPTASADEALISWSMAKSVTHALVGVLVGEGRIDIHEPAAVPEWSAAGDPRGLITLDQLLRMVGGTEFNEDYVDDTTSHCIEMLFGAGADDMGAYTAALAPVAAPDRVFNYSSGSTNLITRILADEVGTGPVFETWMRKVLLDPIGMTSARPGFDGSGTWVGSSYLHATARDFAKFGLLYLRDGVWDGRRLLPEGWVDHARTPRATDDEGSTYGAHWWIWDPGNDVFACQGYETQRILVDPGSDSVIVRLGKTPIEKAPSVDEWLGRILAALR